MELALSNGFQEMSFEEMMGVDGGGPVTMFLSMVAIAVSPAVACLNPLAGVALAAFSIGAFANEFDKIF